MLPPTRMSAKKNRFFRGAMFFALAIFIAGCSPPGPRAFFKGKKFLDRGDYADAAAEFKIATTLLSTNAQVWNYYGVALQSAGQPDDAVIAYQRALFLDRDLMEAHYNLGLLWLAQNKPDAAVTEFTAYTLRRSSAPEGWLKLGLAQLRAGEIVSAEKSFSTALYLSPNNAEALNGLGLARVQRDRPSDAAQFFAAAVHYHPDYAPAILNLATVNRNYLRDNSAALENYQKYLALTPRPANWDEVNAIVNSLEQSQNTVAETVPPEKPATKKESAPREHPSAPAKSQTPPRGNNLISEPAKKSNPPVTVGETQTSTEKPSAFHNLNPFRWFHSGTTQKPPVAIPATTTTALAPAEPKITTTSPPTASNINTTPMNPF